MGSWAVVGPMVLLVLVAACGRIGFDGSSLDAGADGATMDAPIDGPVAFGPWSVPVEIAAMTSDSMDFGPTFSPDTNEVYVAQRFTGDADIYRYTRQDSASPFGGRTAMTALNVSGSTFEEGEPSLTDDGLTIYFNRYAPDRIFVSTRSSITATDWSPPVQVDTLHPALAGFHSPDFAGDKRMVLTRDGMIWESTRPATTSVWSAPVSLGITGNVPCLRRDGLELLWEGPVVIGTENTYAIFRATRPTVNDPFSSPERLSFGALDVAGAGDPELSHDGKTLIFSAEEVPGRMTYDIYIARRAVE